MCLEHICKHARLCFTLQIRYNPKLVPCHFSIFKFCLCWSFRLMGAVTNFSSLEKQKSIFWVTLELKVCVRVVYVCICMWGMEGWWRCYFFFFPKKELCLPSGFLDSWIWGHREMKTFSEQEFRSVSIPQHAQFWEILRLYVVGRIPRTVHFPPRFPFPGDSNTRISVFLWRDFALVI